MSQVPHVTGSHLQPRSPNPTRREVHDYKAWLKQHAASPNDRTIVLRGKLGALTPRHGKGYVTEEHTVVGAVGQEGVTVTDGWGKWSRVQRRQRTALTVLEGYEPVTITVPLLLDARFLRLGRGDIEQLCKHLEWFGGRGGDFHGKPGYAGSGETPIIEMSSKSRLVPYWLQSGRGKEGNLLYVLDTIEYNMLGREWIMPIRRPTGWVDDSGENRAGARYRQAVTLTLIEYLGPSAARLDSAANRQAVLNKQRHHLGNYIVESGHDTFYKIASYLNQTRPAYIAQAAREIQKANPKLGASIHKKLKHGTKVRVPASATSAAL